MGYTMVLGFDGDGGPGMDDLDVRRAARLMAAQHGSLAVDRACDRIRELCAVDDIEGCAVWSGVAAAINEPRRVERRAGAPVNRGQGTRGRMASRRHRRREAEG